MVKMDRKVPGLVFLLLALALTYRCPLIEGKGEPTLSNAKNYTTTERKALDKFRMMVEPDLYRNWMKRDEYLIRWIRDQNFDLDKAQRKLQVSLQWRKENNVDKVLTEDFSAIERLCPYSLDGRDKFGRPVLAMAIGPCPLRRIILTGRTTEVRRMMHYAFEKATKIVQDLQAEGKPIEDGIIIGDLNNFSWREHACLACLPLIIELLTLYESHYPRYVHQLIAINTPRIFENVVKIVWPVLSEHSRSIFTLYGFDKNEWKEGILKIISPEQLQPQFGGTKIVKKRSGG